jgi:hypothetical protein
MYAGTVFSYTPRGLVMLHVSSSEWSKKAADEQQGRTDSVSTVCEPGWCGMAQQRLWFLSLLDTATTA